MSKTINLNLDTSKSDIQNPKILLRQGDGNYQTLRVTITSNGEPTDLTNADVLYLGTTSADHKIIDSNITKVDALNGVIDYRPPKQWGQDMGNFKNSYFEITTGDSTGSTASFKVSVLEAVDLNAEQAGDYITVVDGIVAVVRKELSDQLDDVKTKTDNATGLVKQASDNLLAMAQNYNTDITNKYNDANAKASNINQLLNTGAFAKVGASNTFSENQTMSKDLTVGGALHANADWSHNSEHANNAEYAAKSGHADNASHSDKTTLTDYIMRENDQVMHSLQLNGNFSANGDSVTQKLDVNGPLFAHQDVTGFGSIVSKRRYVASSQAWQGFTFWFDRIGNTVTVDISGLSNVKIDGWVAFGASVPIGYRPAHNTVVGIFVGNNPGFINVGSDGSLYNGGVWNVLNNDYDKQIRIYGSWTTLDDLPG